MNNKIDKDQIFNQSCADYLQSLGVDAHDGDMINCPFRAESDSGAFSINGSLWHDFVTGESGNTWTLAMEMNNQDKKTALESLYKSADIPFVQSSSVQDKVKELSQREKVERALQKVQEAFCINDDTPAHVTEYLKNRKVADTTIDYFAYIPKGALKDILSDEEVQITGLKEREELLIFWYFKNHKPVYYCTRDIETKSFKKAPTKNTSIEHPIWNCDALYNDEHVVWGEGIFDCTSLLEMGYGVAGEITCNLIHKHKDQLLTALRWRAKHHPEWTFTICLDNDAETKTGRHPGNEASERIAVWLWENGVDIKWVKHDPTDSKIDINNLHQHGLESQIKSMIDEAPFVSEIVPYDSELCLRNFVQMLSRQDYRGANRMYNLISSQNENESIAEVIKKTHLIQWEWRKIYKNVIKDIFMYGSDIYVMFRADRFGNNSRHYEIFKPQNFANNMRKYQLNKSLKVEFSRLDIEYKRPTWKVSKEALRHPDMYNLFAPSALLLQEPSGTARIPQIWNQLLDNMAGAKEKDWLLNHMATYVQTLHKPRTIPVFVGAQGTGKTLLAQLFGEGIGGFATAGNTEVESQFNNYLLSPVVLLDELASNQRESNHLKNKLKAFINESQSINIKHKDSFTAELNNYVVIASNESVHHVPLVIEKDDRRYTIITGGKNKNLGHEEWFDYGKLYDALPDFMLYLLSRPFDEKMASVPLVNEKKMELTGMGEDIRVRYVREYIDEYRSDITQPSTCKVSYICKEVNEQYRLQYRFTSKTMKPILQDLGYEVIEKEHQLHVVIPSYENSYMETSGVTYSDPINDTTDEDEDDIFAILDD